MKISKIIVALIWVYYAALIYTGFVDPNHDYLNYLDNATTLYMVIHVPLNLFLGLLALILVFQGKAIKEKIKEEIEKSDKKSLDNLLREGKKFKSKRTRFYLGLSRLVTMFTTVTVFVMLGYMWLGAIMLIGTFASGSVLNYCRDFYEEVENA